MPATRPDRTDVFHQFTVRVTEGSRDELSEHLKRRGIGTAIYYPLPLHLQRCFDYLGYDPGDFPEAERASREVLSLPIFPELTPAEQERVATSISSFFGVALSLSGGVYDAER